MNLKKPLTILIPLIILFTAIFSLYSIIKHNNFNSYALDLGIYDQTIWRYSELNGTENTVLNVPNLLGDHFEAILIPLGAIMKVIPDVRILLIIQAFAMSVTVIPLYFLIFKRTKSEILSLSMCFCFLIFFGTQSAIDFDFHPIVLAVPLLTSALYFFEEKRYVWTSVFLLLALLCKESVSMYIVFFGVYGIFSKKNIFYSLGLIGFGVASFYAITKWIMPAILGKAYQYFQFSAFGKSLDEAIINVIKNPISVLTTLFSNQTKILSQVVLVGSTGLLIFLGGSGLIIIAPMIAERFLSDRIGGWSPYNHYSATIAPFLFWLAAIGIIRVKTLLKDRVTLNIIPLLCIFVVICTILIGAVGYKGKRAPIYQNMFNSNFYADSQKASLEKAVSMIPKDSPVAAQDTIVPHLSHRKQIYPLPRIENSEYIVFNTTRSSYPIDKDTLAKLLDQIKSDDKYKLIYQEEQTYLFKKN